MKDSLLKFHLLCVLYWAHMDVPELSAINQSPLA
jgi:hypothetical protein